MTPISQLKKEFVKTLKTLCPHRHTYEVFRDWLELAAIELHQSVYHAGDFPKGAAFERCEAQYLDVAKRYNREELMGMVPLLSYTILAHQQGFGDFLGEIASEQELLNQDGGQFFTPYDLCRMMARVTFGNVRAQVEEKGIITISEPACGGGALVIASAEEILRQGIDPRAHAQFDCIDVSRLAFNMTYLQLSCLDLQAMVRHGNTLSNEMWESRPTPQLRHFDQWLQERRRQLAPILAMRDLIHNPESFLNPPAADIEAPAPTETSAAAPTVPEGNITEAQQISLFDQNTFTSDAADKKRRQRGIVDLPSPEHRQLDIFSGREGQ